MIRLVRCPSCAESMRECHREYGVSLFVCPADGHRAYIPNNIPTPKEIRLNIVELEVRVQKTKPTGADETALEIFREFIMWRFTRVE